MKSCLSDGMPEIRAFLDDPQLDLWRPERLELLRTAARHLHRVFPRQSGFTMASGLLVNLFPRDVLLPPHALRLFVHNLWAHQVNIPWSWTCILEDVLFERTTMTAPALADALVDAALHDPRNPARPQRAIRWNQASRLHPGNQKKTMADLVHVQQEGDAHLCLVADGVSRATVGSAEKAVSIAAGFLERQSAWVVGALRELSCSLEMETWVQQAKDLELRLAQGLNAALIEAIRDCHEGPLTPAQDIMSLTCTMAVIQQDRCLLAQCGDTAAFVQENGHFFLVTEEHTVRYENVRTYFTGAPRLAGPPAALTRLLPHAVDTAGVQVLLPSVNDLFSFSFVHLSPKSRLLLCTDGLVPKNLRRRAYLRGIFDGLPPTLPIGVQADAILQGALSACGEDNLGFVLWAPVQDAVIPR